MLTCEYCSRNFEKQHQYNQHMSDKKKTGRCRKSVKDAKDTRVKKMIQERIAALKSGLYEIKLALDRGDTTMIREMISVMVEIVIELENLERKEDDRQRNH